MKIAVLGNGAYASEIVEYLQGLGAMVKWYAKGVEGATQKKILRVHKRFLSLNETPETGRLTDLFRIIFEQNPSDEITQQMQGDNKDIFEKLTDFEMDYLKSRFESFEDFDLIIDTNTPRYAGMDGVQAIGESTLELKYAQEKWSLPDQTGSEIAIVGEAFIDQKNIDNLIDWLIEGKGRNRVFYISDNGDPLSNSEYQEALSRLEEFEQKRVGEFLSQLKDWEKLEDYEKVKIPKPEDPIPTLVYFSGHNITAISKLSDQDRLYITCEIPAWRKVIKGEDNARRSLKTIAVDDLWVCQGYQAHRFYQNMRKIINNTNQLDDISYEPGLIQISLDENRMSSFQNFDQVQIYLDQIIHHYFSKVEA